MQEIHNYVGEVATYESTEISAGSGKIIAFGNSGWDLLK